MKNQILFGLSKATGEKHIYLETPEREGHGDYSTNIAMIIAKKEDLKPIKYAREVVAKLLKDNDLAKIVSKIEAVEPGFINFFLSEKVLLSNLKAITSEKDRYGSSQEGKGETVVVDYSSPNIAKRFGIGHLRSTIIGQSLCNLYGFLGYKVVGDNHLGDWGTQFGTLLYQITSKNLNAQELSIDDLEELYVKFNKEADENPELWDEARKWFRKLEEDESEARKIWETIVKTSKSEFGRIYKILGVSFDHEHGESFYEDKMQEAIDEIRKKKLSKKSREAEIVEFEGIPPAILLKSDGATTYFTRDLATIKYRLGEWSPGKIIYEVGSEQKLHFRQVFATAKLLGWIKGEELVHIAHGLIRFKDGKMSTRKGQGIKLEEVLEESIKRGRKVINKSDTSRGLPKKEIEKVANAVGIGAIKYFDLSHHYSSDIIFDWEKLFVLEGNSAPYLQYTIARTNSILQKAKKDLVENNKEKQKLNNEELLLVRTLARFPEVIIDATKNYSPNLICNYLFDLAQKYNNFYNQHRIIEGENEGLRLELTESTGCVLKNGLTLLGIESPEKM
ncbi:arginine--tRNA ligase [Patescibacteria group bacterium]|nr:arginine--tRNA ligase [Patescibacteria group bacterium]MBU0777245.1 arginine--tRNA ligase [Patescibacteria group bacterium]MBU0845940.1 arginine--tRNA ligase [Patescibacteria group bacterium]MBU0922968.1 arginine--tRNA ligase [Patescibacteria group bacterium]MBU1066182.1 arginine--tRNA ligase [Patescibacteria group bacterium]